MKLMNCSIQTDETGNNIRNLMNQKNYSVKDVKDAMGFENPQAVYKWLSGKSIPSTDNLVRLSRLFEVSMEDILVVDENFPFIFLNHWMNDLKNSW